MDDEHVNYNPWIKPIYTLAETNIDVQKKQWFSKVFDSDKDLHFWWILLICVSLP